MRVAAAVAFLGGSAAFRTRHGGPGEWSDIPGYKVHAGEKCAGHMIASWADGSSSHYGSASYTSNLQCAQECNEHSECAGFYVKSGKCAHWRRGELQDAQHTPHEGYSCYVKWQTEDLSDVEGGQASLPFSPPAGSQVPSGPQVSDCLCVFDVDRTLTAKQGWNDCPGTEAHNDIVDHAYNGGTLILSELALNIRSSFCGQCYLGMVSAGTASGPHSDERAKLDELVDPQYNVGGWVDHCPSPVTGTKVMACGEGIKQRAVDDIVAWLGENGVTISPSNVHFYDDKANNVGGFIGSPYHAHQVSCGSRDHNRGGCGGTAAELSSEPVGPDQAFC